MKTQVHLALNFHKRQLMHTHVSFSRVTLTGKCMIHVFMIQKEQKKNNIDHNSHPKVQSKFVENERGHHITMQRLVSSAACVGACWYLFDSDGLYVNSEVSSPYCYTSTKSVTLHVLIILQEQHYRSASESKFSIQLDCFITEYC